MERLKNMYSNGIYIAVENNSLHRVQCHHGHFLRLEDSSFADELISNLEYDISNYKRRCQTLINECEQDEGDLIDRAETFINDALDIAMDLIEIDGVIGELLYAEIINGTALPDDGDGYYQFIINHTKAALLEPIKIRSLMFQVLCKNAEYDDLVQWLEESVLSETNLFRNRYHSEITYFLSELRQLYYFNSTSEYYSFMLLHFANERKRIQICKFCGNFFVPKTKRTTLYCDRVIPYFGKTCKQIAPKMRMKEKLDSDPLLAEYERAKNRYYKRVERTDLKNNTSISGKRLTFEQYEEWYQKASADRRNYLSGEMSGDEFREIILELD